VKLLYGCLVAFYINASNTDFLSLIIHNNPRSARDVCPWQTDAPFFHDGITIHEAIQNNDRSQTAHSCQTSMITDGPPNVTILLVLRRSSLVLRWQLLYVRKILETGKSQVMPYVSTLANRGHKYIPSVPFPDTGTSRSKPGLSRSNRDVWSA